MIVEMSPLPLVRTPLLANLFSTGGYVFSYSLAAFIVAIGLLIGWACQVPSESGNRRRRTTSVPGSSPRGTEAYVCGPDHGHVRLPVGRCQDRSRRLRARPLGPEVRSGFGAAGNHLRQRRRVILQGPCTFQVESKTGGYLSLGKLTARVKKKGEGGRMKGEEGSLIGGLDNPGDQSRLSLAHPPCSARVRTPTATVTDLGTEFGVEVDKSGGSKTYVCEGKVEIAGSRRQRRQGDSVGGRTNRPGSTSARTAP